MSTIINAECVDQELIITNSPVIASGGIHENFVAFKFCSKWDGLGKTAVFYRNEKEQYCSVLDANNVCEIPHEVTDTEGTFYFGVFGVSDDTTKTSKVLKYKVTQGSKTESLNSSSEPTPDIYQQILSAYGTTNDAIEKEVSERKASILAEETARKQADSTEKAERQAEIAVERARINALTKMEPGSTMGDAELQDIRIGADGVTYETAGASVRAQVTNIKSDLSNLYSEIVNLSNKDNVITVEELEQGMYLLDNGEPYETEQYVRTTNYVSGNFDIKVEDGYRALGLVYSGDIKNPTYTGKTTDWYYGYNENITSEYGNIFKFIFGKTTTSQNTTIEEGYRNFKFYEKSKITKTLEELEVKADSHITDKITNGNYMVLNGTIGEPFVNMTVLDASTEEVEVTVFNKNFVTKGEQGISSVNKIEVTVNSDGSSTFNGTPSQRTQRGLSGKVTLPKGTYYTNVKLIYGSNYADFCEEDSVFTLTEETELLPVAVFEAEIPIDNVTIYPMICKSKSKQLWVEPLTQTVIINASTQTGWETLKTYKEVTHVKVSNNASIELIYKATLSENSEELEAINKELQSIGSEVFKYEKTDSIFESEINSKFTEVQEKTTSKALIFALVTDTHYQESNLACLNDTVRNLTRLNEKLSFDGVIHLGDVINGGEDANLHYDLMNKAVEKYLSIGAKRTFFVTGNHDNNGLGTTLFSEAKIYQSMHRINESDVYREGVSTNYYIDYPNHKIRVVFLDSNYTTKGFSDSTVDWLSDVLSNAENDYKFIIFSHQPTRSTLRSSDPDYHEFVNTEAIETLLNTYVDRVMGYIHGHCHFDNVSYVNEYPEISINCNYTYNPMRSDTPNGATVPPYRTLGTKNQDCWDMLIVLPNENKFEFIRFGAGVSRTVPFRN